ncbi:MAG: hypothetical protein J6A97_06765 [Clostridia bacterium]|nr:hypothetical protein [Clostridia bacterium]
MNSIASIFAKIIAVLMSFIYMFVGGNPEKIEVRIEDPVTTESTEIEYVITNYTGKTVYADKFFTVEKSVDGQWVAVPFAEDTATEEIAIRLLNCQSVTLTVDLLGYFGKTLEKGEYRLILPGVSAETEFTVE